MARVQSSYPVNYVSARRLLRCADMRTPMPFCAALVLLVSGVVACGRSGLLIDELGADVDGNGRTHGDGGSDGGSDAVSDAAGDGAPDGAEEDGGTITIGPITVPNVPQIVAGSRHACLRTKQSELLCWGDASQGQLANGGGDRAERVLGLPAVVGVAAGSQYSCALGKDQSVWCFGENLEGQLGRGTRTESEPTPAQIVGLSGTIAIAASGPIGEGRGSHTCALDQDGRVRCWGLNTSGECALTTADHALTPNLVPLPGRAVAIAAGGNHTCALLVNGHVSCWGRNTNGQLGRGTSGESENQPDDVRELTGAIGLMAGDDHTCAWTSADALFCWGDGFLGELGDGRAQGSKQPRLPVRGLSGTIAAAGGVEHTCRVHKSGTVSCWGKGSLGELGNGKDPDYEAAPVDVIGVTDAVRVAAGGLFSCVARRERGAFCWGGDFGGLTPVAVDGL